MADTNKTLNIILSATDKMTTVINSAVNSAVTKLNSMQQTTDKMANSAFAMGRSMGAIGLTMGAPLVSFVKAAEESQAVNAKLEQVFKSMGDSSGKAAAHARELATSLQMEIAIDDEKILEAQAKLATFEKVIKNTKGSTEVFDRATRAAFDLQAAGFGDANSNVVQLGKALQDPIKGITALNKSGVTFTAIEKSKIAALVQSGKHFEAQQLLLSAVEKQVGGVAKASAKDSAKMAIAFGEIQEQLGAALLPELAKLTQWISGVALPAFTQFMEKNGETVAIVMKVAAAIAAASLAISGLSFVFGGLMKVISVGFGAFKLLASGIGFVTTAFRVLTMAMMSNPILLIIGLIIAAGVALYMNWDTVKKYMLSIWESITWAWNKGGEIITATVDWIGQKISGILGWFGGLGTMFYNAGSNIATSIWEGIKSGWTYITDGMQNLVSGIRAYLPFSPAKVGPLKDLHKIKFVETMMMGFNPTPAIQAVSGMAGAMAGVTSPMSIGAGSAGVPQSAQGASAGGGTVVNYNPTVSITGGTEQDRQSFMGMLNEHKIALLRMLESEQQKQNRKKY